jgi:ubiquitin-protein ligase
VATLKENNMAGKMPSQEERLKRIKKNYEALPKSKRQNLKKAPRSAENIRHAQGTASGSSLSAPQKRYKQK